MWRAKGALAAVPTFDSFQGKILWWNLRQVLEYIFKSYKLHFIFSLMEIRSGELGHLVSAGVVVKVPHTRVVEIFALKLLA